MSVGSWWAWLGCLFVFPQDVRTAQRSLNLLTRKLFSRPHNTPYFVFFIIRAIRCWQLLNCYFHLSPLIVPWLSIKIPNRIQASKPGAGSPESAVLALSISSCLPLPAPRKLRSRQAELFILSTATLWIPLLGHVLEIALFLITGFKSGNGIWHAALEQVST